MSDFIGGFIAGSVIVWAVALVVTDATVTDAIEGFVTIAIILGAIALLYAAGRWAKRQIEGPPGDWVAAKLAGLWRRFR